jgi:sulfur carrier protein
MEMRLTINGAERRFAPALTVERLIGELGIAGKRVAIERNGEIVPRSRYSEVTLSDGDRLEVVVAVGGG